MFDARFTRLMWPDCIEICGVLNKAKKNTAPKVFNCTYRAHIYALFTYWKMSLGQNWPAPPNCLISFLKEMYVECNTNDHECDSASEVENLYGDDPI